MAKGTVNTADCVAAARDDLVSGLGYAGEAITEMAQASARLDHGAAGRVERAITALERALTSARAARDSLRRLPAQRPPQPGG